MEEVNGEGETSDASPYANGGILRPGTVRITVAPGDSLLVGAAIQRLIKRRRDKDNGEAS